MVLVFCVVLAFDCAVRSECPLWIVCESLTTVGAGRAIIGVPLMLRLIVLTVLGLASLTAGVIGLGIIGGLGGEATMFMDGIGVDGSAGRLCAEN